METYNDTLNQKELLPEAQTALTLSIVGNALGLCFFIPFLGILCCIAGVILSIMGLAKGRSGMELWKVDKKRYQGGSFAKTLIGFILGIVGIVQGAIMSFYAVFFTILVFSDGFRHF